MLYMWSDGLREGIGMKKCDHTFYMREVGIQCTKCLILWEKGMD
jgi:hypothetical protein